MPQAQVTASIVMVFISGMIVRWLREHIAHRGWSAVRALLEDHMTCFKKCIPSVAWWKGPVFKPTTDQGCKHMAHERCGPRFVLRGTDFTKVAVPEVGPTVGYGMPSQQGHHRVMGFSPDWCEAVTVSRHVKLDDFHPSEEALTSRSRYSSIVSQSRALRCSVFGWWWEAKWKLNDTVHCFHLNVPFQVFGFIAFMMAVNQTPGLNLNMECYLLWEQLHWWTGRCVCRATSSELNLYRFYHSALHISVILANADKMKGTRFKK